METCLHTLDFRKATASGNNDTGPNCVEVATYRTADASGAAGHCVQVGFATATASVANSACVDAGVATADIHTPCTPDTCTAPGVQPGDTVVRDSKDDGTGPWVVFRAEEWREYVTAVLAGAHETVNGQYVIRDPRNSTALSYTPAEWFAFLDGCGKGEFTYDAVSTIA